MRSQAVAAALTGVLLGAPAVDASGVVQWDLFKRHHPKSSLRKRDAGTQTEVIENSLARGGYFATCTVGTPGQDMILQLDTGSSDIWVPWSEADICGEDECSLGSFDPDASSSFDDFGKGDFDISYVDGTHSTGDYFRDAFSIAKTTLSNLTMGLGKDTTIAYGLVGVGYTTNEAIISTEQSTSAAYANLPALMVDEGIIATNAFSLWLNDLDASQGSILFGGVDTEKYVGDMTSIDVLKNNLTSEYDSFLVALTSIHAISDSGTDELTSHQSPIQVVLDSGTTLSYLPTDIAQQIWTEVGAEYSASEGLALIPCKMQTSTGYFAFTLGGPAGPRINITMDELVIDVVLSGPAPTFGSGKYRGEEACWFGIQNTTSSTNLLGDTFLRSAYVVYDLTNNRIGLAQTDFNATDSNVVAFQTEGAAIPSATPVASNGTAQSTASFTMPGFVAQTGFANGTESAASGLSSTGMPALGLLGTTTLVAFLGGAALML